MGAAMSDFAAQISDLVQIARESASRQRDAERQHEEGEARRLKACQDRAAALIEPIWELIQSVAHASDGAITVEKKRQSTSTIFALFWHEGQPDRSLRILVDEADGMIQASWVVPPNYGRSVDAPNVSVTDFEIASVEAAILLLADQRCWARGAIPMIPW